MFQYTGTGVAFSLFGIDVRWYAVFIVSGMILSVFLASREAPSRGIKPDDIYDLALWIFPSAIVGARLWYVIFEWQRYAANPISALNIRGGGLAIQGGVMAALIAGWIFCKKRKISFARLADLAFPFLAMAQAIGRWGNFTNNEAYGGPTNLPWALIVHGQKVHPTFLYESLGDFAIFLFLWWYSRYKNEKDGQVSMLYLILYGILRFFVEGLRTDSLWWGPIRVAQLLSVIGILIGIAGLVCLSRSNATPSHPPFKKRKQ